MAKWAYAFGGGAAEGSGGQRDPLGGKGANLAEMARLGLPVPPGFTVTTEVCTHFYAHDRHYPEALRGEVEAALGRVGALTGRGFGDERQPLLVSVRSGARASMPGMMDTVLNLGLNDRTVVALAETAGDERFAYDSYRRFIQMYCNVVLDLSGHGFEEILEEFKEDRGAVLDTDLDAADWRKVIERYKAKVWAETGRPFPQDPREQLWGAIGAVFSSWMNSRAKTYRRLNAIPESWGTAVTVQAMVFGNMGDTSATGVAFTRDPSIGTRELYGEFLPHTDEEMAEVAASLGLSADKVRRRAQDLHEFNPMLGFRGVRLAIAYPEIAEMQARAIFEGAVQAGREGGQPVEAEIMVPLVMTVPELDLVKGRIVAMAEAVAKETGVAVPYTVGTMIELPRAALKAGEIARSAEFFSFGTNDLTQTTLGISRDDAASFLGPYTAKGILPADPFVTLDQEGVGELVAMAAERGRATRPGIKLGICGEHGGDPASIDFCERQGLDYVSCSPFRVPIARLAAAQAAIDKGAAGSEKHRTV